MRDHSQLVRPLRIDLLMPSIKHTPEIISHIVEHETAEGPFGAKGVGELGLCGVGAAVANAVYNATGVRIRDYPLTLEKHLDRLPEMA